MNKKLIITGLSIIIVLISLNVQGDIILSDDQLDQHQTDYDGYTYTIFNLQSPELEISIAQSFIPQKEILTRIRLFMCKDIEFTPTKQCTITIKDSLNGNILALKSLEPDEFPLYPNYEWIEFDIDDISVTIGETYYIIVSTEPEGMFFPKLFYWGANSSNAYSDGDSYEWDDSNEEWLLRSLVDTCFETYGCNVGMPELSIESITGGIGGMIGIQNVGSANATNLQINITIEGGFIINQTSISATIETLKTGELIEIPLHIKGIGLGILSQKPTITVTANATNVETITKTETAIILGRIILIR